MVSTALLAAPLYTLARYRGMGAAPASLRRAGLVDALGVAEDHGDVSLPELRRDDEGDTKNISHFRSASRSIYSAVGNLSSEKVVMVGGECSVVVGAIARLSEAFEGKAGMLWMDAHGDFNTPATSPSGYIGGMCLAMACGRVPDLQLFGEGKGPPLAEERLVHLGSRALDQPEVLAFNSSPAKLFTAQQVKKNGAREVAEEAARHLSNRSDWIACHLDVDVVDPSLLPAVNYPTPGGLTLEEAATVVRVLASTGKMKVLELAAYNADSDKRGVSAKTIVGLVKRIFA